MALHVNFINGDGWILFYLQALSGKLPFFGSTLEVLGDRYRFLAKQEAGSSKGLCRLLFTLYRSPVKTSFYCLSPERKPANPYANQKFFAIGLSKFGTACKLMNTLYDCTIRRRKEVIRFLSHYIPQKHQNYWGTRHLIRQ